MQEPLQFLVADLFMSGVYGLVVLAEELGPFTLGEITKNYFGVVRILNLGLAPRTCDPSYTRPRTPASFRRVCRSGP